jgi:hypothetical protein|tara:strand:- start:6202 stop:6435 length:234 start_codon:yes stop_codon:yes gene_type:complete
MQNIITKTNTTISFDSGFWYKTSWTDKHKWKVVCAEGDGRTFTWFEEEAHVDAFIEYHKHNYEVSKWCIKELKKVRK